MAKITPQVKVDNVSLDNGTWRRIVGDVTVSVALDGTKSLSCSFLVTGTSHADLLSNWETTQADFRKTNPRVQFWLDSTATNPLEDMYPGDGTHGNSLLTQVSQDITQKQVGFTIMANFIAVTQVVEAAGGAGVKNMPFTGMSSQIAISSTYSAGRIESRTVSGSFTTTLGSAYGPYTIVSASNNGGQVRFTISTDPAAFVEGMKFIVSSSTVGAYVGSWLVTAVNVASKTIDVKLDYSATATGAGSLTNPITGYNNYIAYRDQLLNQYLLVGDDGERDSSTGLALTGEVINRATIEGFDVSFTLDAEWVQLDTTAVPSIRALNYTVQTQKPERWPLGYPKPTIIVVSGSFTIDKEAYGSTTIHSLFNTIKPTVIADVELQVGNTGNRRISEVVTTTPGSMIVQFGMQFITRNTELITLKVSTLISRKLLFTKWPDADGFSIIQTPPESWEVTVTKTVTRTGYNAVDLKSQVSPPQESGYTFTLIGDTQIDEDPDEGTLDGEAIYEQTYAATYMRDKVRSGGITISAPVIT